MTDTVKVQNLMLKVAVVIFALLVCIGAVHTWQSRSGAVATTGTTNVERSARPSFQDSHIKAHLESLPIVD
jgi:hypothetical protein